MTVELFNNNKNKNNNVSPDYITDLITLVANIPTWSSLRAPRNLMAICFYRVLSGESLTVHPVAASRPWNRLPTEGHAIVDSNF